MRTILFILIASLMLVACGTKGDLYIPEQEYPQNNTPQK
ncbi:lipoprotein [Methylobacillus gramineus]|nr:lipoprotein [Methylobacillus gramineus]MCB5185938.1 lipoprotein [Methylobacillus gramineus]